MTPQGFKGEARVSRREVCLGPADGTPHTAEGKEPGGRPLTAHRGDAGRQRQAEARQPPSGVAGLRKTAKRRGVTVAMAGSLWTALVRSEPSLLVSWPEELG